MRTEDFAIRLVHEDIRSNGVLTNPVVRIPVARVGEPEINVMPGVPCLILQHADTRHFRHGKDGHRNTCVIRRGLRVFEHVGGREFSFDHRDGRLRQTVGVGRGTDGMDRAVRRALRMRGYDEAPVAVVNAGSLCRASGCSVATRQWDDQHCATKDMPSSLAVQHDPGPGRHSPVFCPDPCALSTRTDDRPQTDAMPQYTRMYP